MKATTDNNRSRNGRSRNSSGTHARAAQVGTERDLREQIEAELRAQFEAEAVVEMEALRAELRSAQAELADVRTELERERDLERCVSIREAAAAISVSHEYLYKNKNRLPFIVQMGPNRVVASRRKLRDFIEQKGAALEDSKPQPGVSLATADARRRSSRRWK